MRIAETWRYEGGDSCAAFFTHCLRAFNPDVPATARVLEIGSAEWDWLSPAHQSWPDMTITGIDWRRRPPADGCEVIEGDVLTHDFPPESFDLVVSISTIEHIGLGHYRTKAKGAGPRQDPDPVSPQGDTKTLQRVWSWLKPGGLLFFDVPYRPDRFSVQGTSHREYDYPALWTRLWQDTFGAKRAQWCWTGYAHANATGTLVTKPFEPVAPFHYVGMWWQK